MQKINQLINQPKVKKHFFITLLGALIGALLGYYLLVGEQQNFTLPQFFLTAFSGIVIGYGCYLMTKLLDKSIPWKKQVGTRLLLGIIAHFVLSFSLFFILFSIYNLSDIEGILSKYQPVFIKLGILLFILAIIYQIIYFALYSYYSYASLQVEEVKQERKQVELQLNALKSQLSPHFLFNGLNTISSLIYKDETRAKLFIRKLAKMYDYTLKSYHSKLITIREELEFVHSYIYLVETRFENKFSCKISINDNLIETKIPPLTLQMLIENAVKHNTMSNEEPLSIHITSDQKHITIQNNITSMPYKVNSFKIGLKNISSRYLLLHGEGIIITNGNNFVVKIPIIR
ncbi:histidine kinase [uncultured Tenacibaculum sp.]|uniref:sensor histidine kinase n=1 Tax=uncultured Tenacibaculum sp. TaxID=174713 RepID=UPI002608E383|nr:histidine kinase [uncultured Tenacibaculum sp.]